MNSIPPADTQKVGAGVGGVGASRGDGFAGRGGTEAGRAAVPTEETDPACGLPPATLQTRGMDDGEVDELTRRLETALRDGKQKDAKLAAQTIAIGEKDAKVASLEAELECLKKSHKILLRNQS